MTDVKQVGLCYAAFFVAAMVSVMTFEVCMLNRWLALLSDTKWYLPYYSKIFLPALLLSGVLWLSVMARLRSKLLWILASLGHGVVVAIACCHLGTFLDGNYEAIEKFWRFNSLYQNLLFEIFVGAGPLLGWLYSGILWGEFLCVSIALKFFDLELTCAGPVKRSRAG